MISNSYVNFVAKFPRNKKTMTDATKNHFVMCQHMNDSCQEPLLLEVGKLRSEKFQQEKKNCVQWDQNKGSNYLK